MSNGYDVTAHAIDTLAEMLPASRLGARYIDSATGYVGHATARMEDLGGNITIRLERLDNNGKVETVWFAESRLTEDEPSTSVGFTPTKENTDGSN
jgi:hypothetical protein